MPQLDPTWFASQLFWLTLCFAALYTVLSRLVLPPLLDIMARRNEAVASDIETAQSLKGEAEQARLDYEKTLAEARHQAQGLMTEALAEQKAKAEARGRELERQIEQRLTAASVQIEARKNQMMDELTPAISELAGMIVEKLTQSQPSTEQVSQALTGTKGRR